jgi:hypothetical protein
MVVSSKFCPNSPLTKPAQAENASRATESWASKWEALAKGVENLAIASMG